MLQTSDEPPAYIIVKTSGWVTGAKDVLDKVNDPNMADAINPNTYKYRVNLSMETGDERYAFLNTLMWIGSGCRRGHEGWCIFYPWPSEHPLVLTPISHFRCFPGQLICHDIATLLSVFERVISVFDWGKSISLLLLISVLLPVSSQNTPGVFSILQSPWYGNPLFILIYQPDLITSTVFHGSA